jgi:hypothetical protein
VCAHPCAAFSLLELLVVLAIAILLTSLLMPAFSELKESANKVVCSSNQRELGLAMFMYAGDWDDELPPSKWLPPGPDHGQSGGEEAAVARPQELMAANSGGGVGQWDGTGLLFVGQYCDAPGCYYCPSHRGEHPFERYQSTWLPYAFIKDPIYTNYHYAGNRDWEDADRLRSLHESAEVVLLTDGLRTQQDFNHLVGMNVLKADGSVNWRDDNDQVYERLPRATIASDAEASAYRKIWAIVEDEAQK